MNSSFEKIIQGVKFCKKNAKNGVITGFQNFKYYRNLPSFPNQDFPYRNIPT